MKTKPECYGKMFPPVVEMAHNEAVLGKVFGYRVDYSGGVANERAASVNHEQWDRCLNCPEFDSCYPLSIGTMLMELAVKSSPQTLF